MKTIKLKLLVEITEQGKDITDEDLLANIRRLVVGNGTFGMNLSLKIKGVQPLRKTSKQ